MERVIPGSGYLSAEGLLRHPGEEPKASLPSSDRRLIEDFNAIARGLACSNSARTMAESIQQPESPRRSRRLDGSQAIVLGFDRPSATTASEVVTISARTPTLLCVEALRMGSCQQARALSLAICCPYVGPDYLVPKPAQNGSSMQKKLARKIGFLPAAQRQLPRWHGRPQAARRGPDRCPRRVSRQRSQRKRPYRVGYFRFSFGRGSVVAGDDSATTQIWRGSPRWAANGQAGLTLTESEAPAALRADGRRGQSDDVTTTHGRRARSHTLRPAPPRQAQSGVASTCPCLATSKIRHAGADFWALQGRHHPRPA